MGSSPTLPACNLVSQEYPKKTSAHAPIAHLVEALGSNSRKDGFESHSEYRRKIMANKDGTGPNNQGPRTGRGAGNCPPNRTARPTRKPAARPGRPGKGNAGTGRSRNSR